MESTSAKIERLELQNGCLQNAIESIAKSLELLTRTNNELRKEVATLRAHALPIILDAANEVISAAKTAGVEIPYMLTELTASLAHELATR